MSIEGESFGRRTARDKMYVRTQLPPDRCPSLPLLDQIIPLGQDFVDRVRATTRHSLREARPSSSTSEVQLAIRVAVATLSRRAEEDGDGYGVREEGGGRVDGRDGDVDTGDEAEEREG